MGQKIRNSALFTGLGLSPSHNEGTLQEGGVHTADVAVSGGVDLEEVKVHDLDYDDEQKEAGPADDELEVELHEHRDTGKIIPGSTETDV